MQIIKFFVFSVTSIITAIITLITVPFNIKGKFASIILKIWANTILKLYGIKVEVYVKENINKDVGKIYISNHSSYLDIFVLLAKIPDNIRMIYRREINRIVLISWAMRLVGFIPINRDNVRDALRSLAKASKKIKDGISYIIFPEGTRSYNGKVGEFKKGFFVLADKSEADIIPVSINGTHNLMPRGSLKVRAGVVKLVIGKTMKFKKDKNFLNEIRNTIISNF